MICEPATLRPGAAAPRDCLGAGLRLGRVSLAGPAAARPAAPCRRRAARALPCAAPRAAALQPAPAAPPAAPPAGSPQAKLAAAGAGVVQLYRSPGLAPSKAAALLRRARDKASPAIEGLDAEVCFNISLAAPLTPAEADTLAWLLRETFEPHLLTAESRLAAAAAAGGSPSSTVVEVGPRMSFSTAWSANAVSVCRAVGLAKVDRLEVSRRYALSSPSGALPGAARAAFAALVHDRMTEQVYAAPLASFASDAVPAPAVTVPVLARGRAALEEADAAMGLAFDAADLDYYTALFRDDLRRDPTNVELFDIAQSNSEHSRHWFFKARLLVGGREMPESLFDIVKDTWVRNRGNSVVGFCDNSSAIRGGPVSPVLPAAPGGPGPLAPAPRDWDVLLTAETHNFPCAVAPYPGAETGAGGRIRDTHATGSGSIMGAATAGYCVGNLRLEGHALPGEDARAEYPPSLAPPLQILLEASSGASDYGNKFGEPLVAGYCRTFGQRLPGGERREWLKPIMFSGGLGQIDHAHLEKAPPQLGWLVVKIGGPAYRIGMGGGAASSVPSGAREGATAAELDFNAVQRGDAEVAQKLWRVVRACVELGPANPIAQIHDQGAGGNCNVVKEIIYPLGAEIDVRAITLGDATMSVLEIWGAEYQENDCLLIRPADRPLLERIAARERCGLQVIGAIDGSGRCVLRDSAAPPGAPNPAVDLDLEKVLGDMPRKTFEFPEHAPALAPLALPPGATPAAALSAVLRLPSVCSKRFLTTKVDRSVTGLVAQQQCVGPLQLPLADVAVMAQAHTGVTGAATAIGEQPLKGLIDPAAMARLALGEALTNLVWAPATALADVKASANWMYAAKMGSEGAAMYAAAEALRAAMLALRVAVDGGKDSLSMAASAGGETVMAPGNLVVSAYVTCPDVTLTVTPDLKAPAAGSALLHVDLGAGRRRLGGSALAQAYGQVGDASPDVDVGLLGAAWDVTQRLIRERRLLAGHDVSDGGLAVAALEMAFAGNVGLDLDVPPPARGDPHGALAALFAEELGLLVEVAAADAAAVAAEYAAAGVPCAAVGAPRADGAVSLRVAGAEQVRGTAAALRDEWEATSFALDRLQAAEECVDAEAAGLAARRAPEWRLPYALAPTPPAALGAAAKHRVAVIREEGSNGDREMAAALWAAGLEPWDVTMSDLLAGRARLDASFRGAVFVGGFSYADVLDSAKGWAATIRFSPDVWAQFQAFYARPDTWSLGVCNGCQLMALLGWVPATGGGASPFLPDAAQPRFVHNASGRFESRWSMVAVDEASPAVLLAGMGGARLGVWCAHGEGRAHFPDAAVAAAVAAGALAPLRYVDDAGRPTEAYPANPNGSPGGIAALCSPDGRHLAMMPHPERCFLGWQLPYAPPGLGIDPAGPGPWLRLFQNARAFCDATPAAR